MFAARHKTIASQDTKRNVQELTLEESTLTKQRGCARPRARRAKASKAAPNEAGASLGQLVASRDSRPVAPAAPPNSRAKASAVPVHVSFKKALFSMRFVLD